MVLRPKSITSPHVLEMSITDHPGIAITYDYRLHRMIRKLAHRRAVSTDYFDLPSAVQSDLRAAVIRDFEEKAEIFRNDKEKQKAVKEREVKTRTGKGADKTDRADAKAQPRGKQWAESDWAAWKKKQNAETPAKEPDGAERADGSKSGAGEKK